MAGSNPISQQHISQYASTDVKPLEGGNKDKAVATGKAMASFYTDQLTADFNRVSANASSGKPNVQDEAKLAADIATLQSMQKQYFSDLGDKDKVKFLTDNPDKFIGENGKNVSTNEVLAASGSSHTKDTDFVYTGMSVAGGQQIDAHLNSAQGQNPNAQGTASFAAANGQTRTSSSSLGSGGQDWSMGGSDIGSQGGGRYNAQNARELVDKLAGGGGTASYGPRERAQAYAQLLDVQQKVPAAEFQNILSKPGVSQLWSQGNSSGTGAEARTDSTAFNRLYNWFNKP